MKHATAIAASLLLPVLAAAQPKISVDKSEIDLGVIYRGATKNASFTIKNIGNEPLKILQVQPSCGCTAVKKPKDVLAPGESDMVEVEFSSASFRGRVDTKRVDILTNDPVAEYFAVKLLAEVREELVPMNGTSLVWFGTVTVGSQAEQKITFTNSTNKPITIRNSVPSSPRLKVFTDKKRLAPNDSVEVVVTVRADKEGYTTDHIDLQTDSKNQPKVTINVSFIGTKGS
ncbi:MAG: hypothetical protein A2X67_08775 [Ignavibacteria bacterium GWA2_55_11]|nr:MAG: hypothetical protein A2X67_08775 [Ignavibacteria bacterium GWA2_55_11]OGU43486.1 MAG: hypothetical protein A2X68_08340 [Ignavibacteria bacterium GWC2_56_12]OGU64008.1 MAG: hypothetical protein A3C56_03965 [Ignavibacteria bacterium RIFCSPHIGHO2_02_FULL_56_12]OGU71900.1 MAG: hypothetical protein A3G43_06385 [Ignavibacteria bacterium RIFCSPLOWO2_12_FULL_56_21]OGU74668.1 MAG: hypothetical protein A3H45_10050 [Ignavibacteria bacterium RIFCSPLOWO2_02_FULL_55_14]